VGGEVLGPPTGRHKAVPTTGVGHVEVPHVKAFEMDHARER